MPDPVTDSAAMPYECFICGEPMTSGQDLVLNPTGIVTHGACMEGDDGD